MEPGQSSTRLLQPVIDRSERKRMFDLLDKDGNGKITAHELQYGLIHHLKVPTNRAFVNRIMEQADTDEDSSITFDEFDQYMSTRERELEAIFKQVDVDNDGSITAEEMAAGLTLLGHSFTPEDVHVMMNKLDRAGKGFINLNDFLLFFIHTPLASASEVLLYWKKPALVSSDGGVKEIVVPPNSTADRGYVLCSFIDSGAFGEVCLVKSQETGRDFAIKRFSTDDASVVAQFHEERDFFSKVNQMGGCKRLVGMHESFVADDMSCLVLSYCPGGNLQSLIEQRVFTPVAVAFYASEAAEAIREIHDLGYVHRDIKAENFLIEHTSRLRLCDFGSCHTVDKEGNVQAKLHVGTPNYNAPEFILGKRRGVPFTQAIDWWALGCTVYNMMFGYLPFESSSTFYTEALILAHKESLKFPIDHTMPPDAISFVRGLLCDVSERLTYDEIRAHPFISRVDWALVNDITCPVDFPAQLPLRTTPAVPPLRTRPATPSPAQGSRPRPPPPKRLFT